MAKKFDVKERILEKSADLFYRRGFGKASIRDIVKAVGITNSTVYLYFKNKDDILFNIIFNIAAELLVELQTLIEKQNDPIECLQAMIIRQICFTTQTNNWKKARIFLEEHYQLPQYLRKKTLEQHRQIYDLYYSKICEIEKNGLLNDKVDKTAITFGIFAMMNWVYRWFKPTGRLSVEEIAENVIDVFFRGILKRKDEEKVWDTTTPFMK
jgi:TetR/AcrR family transcriptional regulator, cholesterol catabolism regulator